VGKKSFVFEGDGLILSTPTGSSAYAYSAGGKIMHRNARKIQLVPICAYKRTLKPMVLGEDAEISVVSDRTADLILDGIYIRRLLAGERLSVRRGKDIAFIIQ
jgi:NAD+ kinase